MIRLPAVRKIALALLLGSMLVVSGCLVTQYTLIDPASGKVDARFVGDWNSPSFDSSGRGAGLIIRNIDDKSYYVEWRTKGESDGVIRAVGQIADIKGVRFAQLRGLEPDGSISKDWMISRLELSGDTLTIRQLDDKFFDEKKIDSSAALRSTIESNLENAAMYKQDETIVATRAK
jgi:hypothetical protein